MAKILEQRSEEIFNRIKQAFGVEEDADLDPIYQVSKAGRSSAKKNRMPIDWLFTCRERTGVSLDWLVDGTDLFAGVPRPVVDAIQVIIQNPRAWARAQAQLYDIEAEVERLAANKGVGGENSVTI